MAVYDLEEQDLLEDLKAWWAQWGNYATATVVAVCVGIIAVQGWRWWQHSQAEQASALYSAISAAGHSNDLPRAKDAMVQLINKYAATGYTPRAALIVARLKFEGGDKAGAQADLQWVIDHGSEEELKEIARYRLAEIQFDAKQYDDALRTLDAKHDEAFAGLYADLKGDILAAAGRADDARTAYQTALAKIDAKSTYRNYVEVKLNALGGPRAAPPIAGATGAPAAAADVATAPASASAGVALPPAAVTSPSGVTVTTPATSTVPLAAKATAETPAAAPKPAPAAPPASSAAPAAPK